MRNDKSSFVGTVAGIFLIVVILGGVFLFAATVKFIECPVCHGIWYQRVFCPVCHGEGQVTILQYLQAYF